MTPPEQALVQFPTLASGHVIGDAYTLMSELPGCDLGSQWLAYDKVLGKDVDLWMLPAEFWRNTVFFGRLRSELQKAKRLIHPHIQRVYELIEDDRMAVIASERLNGTSLRGLLATREAKCFEPGQIEEWLAEICGTLAQAHQVGAVHGALSPRHLIIDQNGRSFCAGFGFQRVIEDWLRLQSADGVAGSCGYRSPQQLDGAQASPADDIYAMGAIIYELLTGEPPFAGPELTRQIREMTPLRISQRRGGGLRPSKGIPDDWDRAVAACLDKNPECRPSTMLELGIKLGLGVPLVGESIGTRTPEGPYQRTEEDDSQHRPVVSHECRARQSDVLRRSFATGKSPRWQGDVSRAVGRRDEQTLASQFQTFPPPAQKGSRRTLLAGAATVGILTAGLYIGDIYLERADIGLGSHKFHASQTRNGTSQVERWQLEASISATQEPSRSPVLLAKVLDGAPQSLALPSDTLRPLSDQDSSGQRYRASLAGRTVANFTDIGAIDADATDAAFEVKDESLAPIPSGGEALFENSLGMKFASAGANVSFCIWPTRVRDFEIFAEETGVKSTLWKTPGFQQGADHPVVNVTWREAVAFCSWLTERDRKLGLIGPGEVYRLPSDLEWSRAMGLAEGEGSNPEARDMSVQDVFPWGRQWPPPPGAGNYAGEETQSTDAINGYEDGFVWTAPVGSFASNAHGLHDMGGNVWQWCADDWDVQSLRKVLRGASWSSGSPRLGLLASCRIPANPEHARHDYGFRVVRAPSPLRTTRR